MSSQVAKKIRWDVKSWGYCPTLLADVLANHASDVTSVNVAKALDEQDPLKDFRSKFHIPPTPETATLRKGRPETVYLCGNSLGLQPKTAKAYVLEEMDKWAQHGVEGHFSEVRPWVTVDEQCVDGLAEIVGAKPVEVVVMNTLTANLHLMMVSFYRPSEKRFKILMEAKAFPSDTHAIVSQIKQRGLDPKDALIQLKPRDGEEYLRHSDIIKAIQDNGDEIALVLLSGVQYYTGQAFQMKEITEAGHAKGCVVGFDLAHAVGNLQLSLHDWGVDFACWCTYKYLNSGPGCISGAFVHERHANDTSLPRFCGWWGHRKEDRFKMEDTFIPIEGAKGWQLSNPPVLPIACMRASVEIFAEAKMDRLVEKARNQTCYMELLIAEKLPKLCSIITPDHDHIHERGCQLSLVFDCPVNKIYSKLLEEGVTCDKREPDVLRVATAPLYNSYADVHEFVDVLVQVVELTQKGE